MFADTNLFGGGMANGWVVVSAIDPTKYFYSTYCDYDAKKYTGAYAYPQALIIKYDLRDMPANGEISIRISTWSKCQANTNPQSGLTKWTSPDMWESTTFTLKDNKAAQIGQFGPIITGVPLAHNFNHAVLVVHKTLDGKEVILGCGVLKANTFGRDAYKKKSDVYYNIDAYSSGALAGKYDDYGLGAYNSADEVVYTSTNDQEYEDADYYQDYDTEYEDSDYYGSEYEDSEYGYEDDYGNSGDYDDGYSGDGYNSGYGGGY